MISVARERQEEEAAPTRRLAWRREEGAKEEKQPWESDEECAARQKGCPEVVALLRQPEPEVTLPASTPQRSLARPSDFSVLPFAPSLIHSSACRRARPSRR